MNTIVITGNLTESKGLRETTNSTVAKRSIAENFGKDQSQFTDLEAWNGSKGQLASQLDGFPKGAYVKVTGFLKHGSYEARDGSKRRTSHVVVTSIEQAERPAKKAAAGASAATPASTHEDAETEEELIVF